MAMLGEALAPASRSGLALFLSRGMWAWAKSLAVMEATPDSPTRINTPHTCERSIVVQLLAAMAMKSDNRRPS